MSGTPFTGLNSIPRTETRAIHEFEVPEQYQGEAQIKTVGLVELTIMEERDAAKRSGTNQMDLAFELWKQAIGEINGAPVSLADGSTDIAVNKMSPQLRALIMTAYIEVNTPKDKEISNFLKGRKIKVA